jgi:hypothetical protein
MDFSSFSFLHADEGEQKKAHKKERGIKIQLLLLGNAEIYGHMIFIRLVSV